MFRVEVYDILNQAVYSVDVESKNIVYAKYDAIDKICKVKGYQVKKYLTATKVQEVI